MLHQKFVMSVGSVIGTEHKNFDHNSQDGYAFIQTQDLAIGIVCDGCGSGKNSEVGAKIGAKFMVEALKKTLFEQGLNRVCWQTVFENLKNQTIEFLKNIVIQFGNDLKENVLNYFLFTVVGFVQCKNEVVVFTCGDGVYSINQNLCVLDENNEPNYLSYGIFSEAKSQQVRFIIQEVIDIANVQTVLIATDGVVPLIGLTADDQITILGNKQEIGDLYQFETDERYLKNTLNLQRRMNVLSWRSKIFGDDATIIVLRQQSTMGGQNGSLD